MLPFLNLDELDHFNEFSEGPFQGHSAGIGEKIGARKLGYHLTVVPPGKKMCPFHNHRVNEEMFLVLEGSGTLRFGTKEYSIKKHDIIACPPGDRTVAHQIVNTGTEDLRYLSLSTREPHEICEYPDSNKILAMSGDRGRGQLRHLFRVEHEVQYLDGETN